ncbi:nitrate/nitrite transporter [Adlercreutzia sp. ZJ473]|uniref:MFS transporter n=1 Tax=Adlercreutzia sp. ZJ473 TaxID=2722822 RepID=UPI001557110F|nr:MFS transporter [Adlercreutzia sp. ZJ473]
MLQDIEDVSKPKSSGLHYAFAICLGGFLTQMIVLSCQRIPSIALEPIRETLGVSYAEVGLITSVFMVFYAGLSIVWGMLGDKIGTRKAITLACVLSAIGAISFGLFAPMGLYIAIATWAIAGIGTAGLLMAILPKIVSRWFAPNKRGFGMSLITPGANFSAIILGIVAPIIIAATGWQATYIIFGGLFAAIAVFVFIVFREGPEEKGLAPYGAPAGTQAAPTPTIEKTADEEGAMSKLGRVLKMPIAWHFGLFYIIYQIAYMAATQYYVSSIQSAGFQLGEAALSITIGGVLTIIVELILGQLSDRFERKNIIGGVVLVGAILGFGYWFYLSSVAVPSLYVCYFFVALISASTGVITVIMTGAGEYFDDDVRATGTGFVGTVNLVGRYLGPWIAGMIIDATGVVGNSFGIVGVCFLVAAIIAFSFPRVEKVRPHARHA